MRNYRNIFSFLSLIVFALMCLPQSAFAGSESNITGWAWSSNIGWISFNNTNTGGSVDYGVNENTDGTLNGYAWSSNIGWIKFGGLSGFPASTDSKVVSSNAQVQGTALVGFARACVGTATGDCTAMSPRADGWDGWISLSGTNYGVTVTNGNFSGYAWGGPVLGWISFDPNLSKISPALTTAPEGCTSPTDCGITTVPPSPGFSPSCGGISLSPGQLNSPSTVVSADGVGGFTGSINNLTVTSSSPALPSGTNYTLSPGNSITCSTNGTCTQLNLSVQLSAAPPADGTVYPLIIQGQSSSPSGISYSCTVDVTAVKPNSQQNNTNFQEF